LDGSKNWSTDGLAAVLAERLLRPGGWLLLDDLGWNYEKHCEAPMHDEIEIARLSDEERIQPHLHAVFDLLIRTNPAFDQFIVQDNWWGWARKAPHVSRRARGGVLSGRNEARGARARLRQISRRAWLYLPPPPPDPGSSAHGSTLAGTLAKDLNGWDWPYALAKTVTLAVMGETPMSLL
jgi:hypothetical protein